MSDGIHSEARPTGAAPAAVAAAGDERGLAAAGGLWPLLLHLLRGQLVPAALWGGVLGLLGFMYVALFPSMGGELEDYLDTLPEAFRAFIPSLDATGSAAGWLNMELFSITAPLALPFFVIILGARAIAGREERGRLDLLLSNPLPRWVLVAATYLTMAGGLLVALFFVQMLTWVGAPLFGVELSGVALLQGVVNLFPYALAFGSLALLLSAVLHRSTMAIVIPGALLIAMYLLQGLGNYSEAVEPLQPAGIFYYYGSAIIDGLDWTAFLGMLGVSLVLAGLAMLAFQRREIYT